MIKKYIEIFLKLFISLFATILIISIIVYLIFGRKIDWSFIIIFSSISSIIRIHDYTQKTVKKPIEDIDDFKILLKKVLDLTPFKIVEEKNDILLLKPSWLHWFFGEKVTVNISPEFVEFIGAKIYLNKITRAIEVYSSYQTK